MKLYLFRDLIEDPVVRRLLFPDGPGADAGFVHSALIAFAAGQALTAETLREYVLRLILRQGADIQDADMIRPYLESDIREVYTGFFQKDWDAVCRTAGLLPFPKRSAWSGAPGEEPYRRILSDMVTARDAQSLSRMVTDFFRVYAKEDEALYRAFRWDGGLTGIPAPDRICFNDLSGLSHQKETLLENTQAFLSGRPANDILLIGGSGTGKSSCVRSTLNHFADRGLRLVQLPGDRLGELPTLLEALSARRLKTIVFLDDLSFEHASEGYLALKVTLDGQVSARPDNVLIYATSNRRHLVRESWSDRNDDDIHQNDTVHETLSLSERFGIRLYFPVLDRDGYVSLLEKMLFDHGIRMDESIKREAEIWATEHNGRSGRSAKQFVAYILSRQN